MATINAVPAQDNAAVLKKLNRLLDRNDAAWSVVKERTQRAFELIPQLSGVEPQAKALQKVLARSAVIHGVSDRKLIHYANEGFAGLALVTRAGKKFEIALKKGARFDCPSYKWYEGKPAKVETPEVPLSDKAYALVAKAIEQEDMEVLLMFNTKVVEQVRSQL